MSNNQNEYSIDEMTKEQAEQILKKYEEQDRKKREAQEEKLKQDATKRNTKEKAEQWARELMGKVTDEEKTANPNAVHEWAQALINSNRK